MQAPAPPPDTLPDFISLEAAAALAIAALVAFAIALLVGSLTRRLLVRIEGDRFQTQPIANATVRAVRRVTCFRRSILPASNLPSACTRWKSRAG